MVYYEVNLYINNGIYKQYCEWLQQHIEVMLSFKGFSSAKLLENTEKKDATKRLLTVLYEVVDMSSLEDYFSTHAKAMRDEGKKLFQDQFSATRRIFSLKESFVH